MIYLVVYRGDDGQHGSSRVFTEEAKELILLLGTEVFTLQGENLAELERQAQQKAEEQGLGRVINLNC